MSNPSFALTNDQFDAFDRRGVIRLDALLSIHRVSRAREHVERCLARLGYWRDGQWRLDTMPKPVWPAHGPKAAACQAVRSTVSKSRSSR